MTSTPDISSGGHTPEPSPLPWDHVESCEHHGAYITNACGGTVCDLYAMSDPSSLSVRNGGTSEPIPFNNADENAAFIARACNSHADLLAALEAAREFVQLNLDELMESCCILDKQTLQPDRSTLDEMDAPEVARVESALAQIDAAIAKAKGGAS